MSREIFHLGARGFRSPISGGTSLAEALASDGRQDGAAEGEWGAEVEAWVENGWAPSLAYYLSSEPAARSSATEPTIHPSRTSFPDDGNRSKAPEGAGAGGEISTRLVQRRSQRHYSTNREVSASEIEGLLSTALNRVAASMTESDRTGIELYLFVFAVRGLEPGLYKLSDVGELRLERRGHFAERLVPIMCGMEAALTGNATLVMTFDSSDRQARFPYERALRELYVQIARMAQWFITGVDELGLGSLITPATNDPQLADLMGLDEKTYPIYTLTFGPKHDRPLPERVES